MVVGLVFSLCVSSFHSSLVGERMLGDSRATSGHVPLIRLNGMLVRCAMTLWWEIGQTFRKGSRQLTF